MPSLFLDTLRHATPLIRRRMPRYVAAAAYFAVMFCPRTMIARVRHGHMQQDAAARATAGFTSASALLRSDIYDMPRLYCCSRYAATD